MDVNIDSLRAVLNGVLIIMLHYKTLTNIRKKHNLSIEELADMMDCTPQYIIALEDRSEDRMLTPPEFVAKLRDKLGLHNVPITEEERHQFYGQLNNLNHMIDYGHMSQAKESIPELLRLSEASCHPSFINLCELFVARYYRAVGEYKIFEQMMAELYKRRAAFDSRHHYYYQRLIGTREYAAGRYHEALLAYKKAERLDKTRQLGEVCFFYTYSMILSDMGYALRATEYLKQAAYHAKWNKGYYGRPNNRFDVYIDVYLAENLSKIGHGEEALAILDKRLAKETRKESSKRVIGSVHVSFGTACHILEDYGEAFKHYDAALQCFEEGSEAYKSAIYRKASVLIDSNRISEGLECIDKALSMPIHVTWKVVLESLRHSVTLSDPKSLEYMVNTAIPELQKYGQYEVLLKRYEALIELYENNGDGMSALKYAKCSIDIYKQLKIEKIERGL